MHDQSNDCTICGSGTYRQSLDSYCYNCPAGSVNPHDNSDAGNHDQIGDCKVCASGKYQDSTASTSCKDCPAGTSRPVHGNDGVSMSGSKNHVADHSNDCIVCSSGKYQNGNGQTSCKTCPAGTHRSVVTNDDGKPWNGGNSGDGDENVANELGDCLVCESGKYQTETTKTECISCPTGTVRIGDNYDNDPMSGSKNTVADETTDCKVCESGTYQDETEKNICKDCPAGTVRATNTHDGDPWLGTAMNQVADHTNDCKVCNSGEYYDANKGTVCKDCPAGTVRAVDGHDNDPWDGSAMNEVAVLQLIVKYVFLYNQL